MTKTPSGLLPVIPFDQSKYDGIKMGETVKVTLTAQSERHIRFHNLYFGGLLELAADYFEPRGGLVSREEREFLKNFIRFLEHAAGAEQPGLRRAYGKFMATARASRASKVAQPELKRHELIDELHRWVKEESGLYDVIETPSGCHKRLGSIRFNRMSEEEFDVFFRGAYNVIWRFLLSRKFKTQEEFDNILNQLMAVA
ncbi:MAG: DUF1367 family protein [Oceanobacter sp.]